MFDLGKVKGILFDFGGTIDTNGVHWSELFWEGYQYWHIPVSKEIFREAYVFGERSLGKNPVVKPHHSFREMLELKIGFQVQWMCEQANLREDDHLSNPCFPGMLADRCYSRVEETVGEARPILIGLAKRYPMVLVSNFYGNMNRVMSDLDLLSFFKGGIVESAVVGVRKPDPAIFRLGVERLDLLAEEVVAVGDSYDKDILPSSSLGCQTIWLKGKGWIPYKGDETADVIVSDFRELKGIFDI